MGDGDGSKIDAIGQVFKARCIFTTHHNGVAGVVHGPAQGVDVFLRLNADGSAESVPREHVDRSTMARAFLDVIVDGHGMAAGLRVVKHAMDKAHF